MASRRPRSRQSYEARRLAARRAGHIRLGLLVGLVVVLIIVVVSLSSASSTPAAKGPGGHGGGAGSSTTSPSGTGPSGTGPSGTGPGSTSSPPGVPAIESQMLSWQLNSALSRSVVLPAAGGSSLIVAGGLEGTGAADQGVYEVNVSTGAATQVGNLVAPLQDAAGAVLAGKGYIFGGGAPTPLTTVQLLPNLGSTKQTTVAASVLEPLAEARSDAATVTIGRTAYLIGGYDGTDPDAAVLATTDGSHFSTVVNLPVPVRDPAVAEVGGRIYVFGGDAITGAHAGEPVATVQMIDTAAHHAAVVGSLPEPLAGAVAATLGGVLYVAGGETITGTGASAQAAASSSVWAWLASSKHAVSAGHLAAAVAYAGLTVIESRAWLVGGETGAGVPVRDVQTFEPKAT